MKRPKRNVEIFSLSALDLFASGLGAFIMLSIILFPFYHKTMSLLAKEKAAEAQISAAQRDTDAARALEARARADEAAARAMKADIAAALQREQATQEALERGKKEMEEVRRRIEAAVKFVFLGIGSQKRSFVIVVDMSGSMRKYSSLVSETVDRIIEVFDTRHQIGIIGFQIAGQDTQPRLFHWPGPGQLAKADPQGRRNAAAFYKTLARQFDGATPTYNGLLAALESPAEAIILLSDGAPTYPQTMDPRQVVEEITRRNGGRKEIHTVALGEYNLEPGLVDFLQQMARRNGGDFAAVGN